MTNASMPTLRADELTLEVAAEDAGTARRGQLRCIRRSAFHEVGNVTRVISWRSYRLPSHARTPRRVARWSHEDTQTSSRAVPRNRLDGQRVELKRSSPPSCSSPLTPKSCRRMKRGAIVTQRREKPGAVWLIASGLPVDVSGHVHMSPGAVLNAPGGL